MILAAVAQIGRAEAPHTDQVGGDERILERDENVERRLRVGETHPQPQTQGNPSRLAPTSATD
jgi:hypothetical protein